MRLVKSFGYALRGLKEAMLKELNMKLHVLASITIIIAGLLLDFNYIEWCVVIISIGLVVGLETMNSAIERLVDFVSPERRAQAGIIKDMSAGAVLVVSLSAFIVGVLLLLNKVLD